MANGSLIPSVGDVVSLISGGPPMTVEALENAPAPPAGLAPGASPQLIVKCVWFNDAGAFAHGAFNAAVLVDKSDDPATPAPTKASPPIA